MGKQNKNYIGWQMAATGMHMGYNKDYIYIMHTVLLRENEMVTI
jgi:hypothetical protein